MSFRPLNLTRPQAESLVNIERPGQSGLAFFEQDLPRNEVLERLGLIEIDRKARQRYHLATVTPRGIVWARFFKTFGFIPATQQRVLLRLSSLWRKIPYDGGVLLDAETGVQIGEDIVFVYLRMCRKLSAMALNHIIKAGFARLVSVKGRAPKLHVPKVLLDGLWELDLELTCLDEAAEDLSSQNTG